MQHIASSKFYDSVLEEVTQNKYYLVLMEGVLDSVDQLKQEDTAALRIASDDELRSHLIQKVADNAHYDPKDEEALFASSYVQYPPPAELNLVHQELYFKARLLCRTPLKAKNSDVTRDRILAIEDPVDQRFFITDGRSDHCAKVLRGFLDEPLQHYDDSPGGDTIAVCWGDEHCKHLLEDLLTRGFEVESEGPTRPYGWSEELYNDTAAKWQAAGKSFNPILA
ncbi:hypothetical protein DIPPA_21467 [Diplonema papillatum]|nr:hypothetical protein DIPPA_12851 [Diplonema papillatum]KAJ9440446.1 hypothetical protein DIPPA_21467 [Diplonema papillatum]|eukprot:gene433-631_t